MKTMRIRYKVLILALGPIALSAVLFVATLIFLESADTFSPSKKTPTQDVLQSIGDFFAIATWISTSILVPLGAVSAAILATITVLKKRKHTKD